MAQLDNDQEACARRPKTSRRTAVERRHHDHLLLTSPCSCSSSSSCCSTSSCCSSAASTSSGSASALNELAAGERNSAKLKRGQYLGRRPRRRHGLTQGRSGSNASATANATDNQAIMQSEPPRPSARTRAEPVLDGLNQGSSHTTTCRSRQSQLDRQLSDSSGIGAQLMNVLRINDDLSSSGSSARFPTPSTSSRNMLLGHHPQQQQQQQQELDTRSLTLATTATSGAAMSSAAATMTTTAAAAAAPPQTSYEHHDHQDQVLMTRGGPQGPLVVVSPIPPLHTPPQYQHQGLYLQGPEASGLYGQHQQPQVASYAMYPMMEPILMHPFHEQHQNNHHHQNRHDHSLAYAPDQLDSNPPQLSYADLDEETARHQSKCRQQRQEQSGPSLPESVIQANCEQLASSQQRPRHNSYYYQPDQAQEPPEAYSEGEAAAMKHGATTLTALNSSLSHSHRHQRLDASTDSRCRVSHGGDDFSSSVGLDVGQQSSQSPNEMEDELKVCEWRDCGNTFLDMNEFVRHLEEKHVNLEPPERNRFFCMWHNCKRNNQEFNARYKLLIHMRVHSGEKPYLCNSESCKKSFSRLENLKIHMRSHTGEKPYKCQYENCSKSFTNSSDRIKHHKTHKDPKPYNCSHEGCTKRYTDPSSLRKHLRAHKKHGFGCSKDSSCEAPIVSDMMSRSRQQQQHQLNQHSSTSCSFSASHLDLSASQSAEHYRLAPDRNQQQHHYQQQQQQQQHSYEQFASSEPVPQHQQAIGIVQDQQELTSYLHADYDPTREFASVLFSPSEPSGMGATRDHQSDLTSCLIDRGATYYEEQPSYERPSYDQQPAANYYQPKEVVCQEGGRYLAPPERRTTSSMGRQRPSYAGLYPSRPDDLHERHQQLSKSWCGGGGGSMASSQPSSSWAQQATPRAGRMETAAAHHGGDLRPAQKLRRRVEFDCASQGAGANYEQSCWTQAEQRAPADFQQQQMEDVRYEKYPNQEQQQQHWQPTTSSHVDIRHSDQSQGQPQQHELTRGQRHAQLMRSMPADVSRLQSRGPLRFD